MAGAMHESSASSDDDISILSRAELEMEQQVEQPPLAQPSFEDIQAPHSALLVAYHVLKERLKLVERENSTLRLAVSSLRRSWCSSEIQVNGMHGSQCDIGVQHDFSCEAFNEACEHREALTKITAEKEEVILRLQMEMKNVKDEKEEVCKSNESLVEQLQAGEIELYQLQTETETMKVRDQLYSPVCTERDTPVMAVVGTSTLEREFERGPEERERLPFGREKQQQQQQQQTNAKDFWSSESKTETASPELVIAYEALRGHFDELLKMTKQQTHLLHHLKSQKPVYPASYSVQCTDTLDGKNPEQRSKGQLHIIPTNGRIFNPRDRLSVSRTSKTSESSHSTKSNMESDRLVLPQRPMLISRGCGEAPPRKISSSKDVVTPTDLYKCDYCEEHFPRDMNSEYYSHLLTHSCFA
uniref:5-azacytidine-induced protein 2-like isoform X2 n=1 Tax=Myxine glutinosa TaxID=7769 RepID=UPI00358E519B